MAALPVQADEPPLTPAEEREILAVVEELPAARQEIAALKDLARKDAETIAALQAQIKALEDLKAISARKEKALEELVFIKEKIAEGATKLAVGAEERRIKAEAEAADQKARADKLEKWGVWGTVGGLVIGFIGHAVLALF